MAKRHCVRKGKSRGKTVCRKFSKGSRRTRRSR
jgi:hypothetical protein